MSLLKTTHLTYLALSVFILLLCIPSAYAALIVDQPLTWGTFGMTNNNSVSSLTINTNGSTSVTGSIVEIVTGTPGIFTVTLLPVDQTINSVDVSVVNAPQLGASETFTLDNFTVIAPASTTGDQAQITVGARLRTTGSTTGYVNGVYNGVIEIVFNF